MTWGASLRGFRTVTSRLDALDVRFEGDAVYVVGTNVEYAVFVEFGTSKMDAQPYLRPAVESVQRDLDQIAAGRDSLDEVVAAVAFEIERRATQNAPVDTGNLQASVRAERVR